jgi:opacity protein-like surface antigen
MTPAQTTLMEANILNSMSKCAVGCLLVLAASTASAQEPKLEIGGTLGWTFADGVSGQNVTVPGVGTFNAISPKDSFSWGLRVGVFVTEHAEVGFLFNEQASSLQVSGRLDAGGGTRVDVGNEKIRNYHGYFAWDFGQWDDKVRPYLLGGMGATQYGSVNAQIGDVQRNIGGTSKFSTTWAAGVKYYPNERVALRLESRWTPTYIKSDAAGWWCDPFWGCYVVSNAQYSNQFELSGGLTLRF